MQNRYEREMPAVTILWYFSVKPPRRRRGRGVFGLNTPRQGGGGRGVFKPNTPMPSQGKVVLQFIPRPPGSIWRAGDGIWKVGGGIWREEQISDNLDSKPENYLWGFEVGSGIIWGLICKANLCAGRIIVKLQSLFKSKGLGVVLEVRQQVFKLNTKGRLKKKI